jgi:hypothetical protein
MVRDCVTRIVEIIVDAGICVVKVIVEPESVVTIVWPGSVTVDTTKLVTVVGGNCDVKVVVIGGSVNVEITVEAGSCVVMISPGKVMMTGGTVTVDTTVLAGCVLVVVTVTRGSVDVEVIVRITV